MVANYKKIYCRKSVILWLQEGKMYFLLSVIIAGLLAGCGVGDSSAPAALTQISTEKTGYLIDSAVEGVDYLCDNISGITDSEGKFTYNAAKCQNGVEFKLGNLTLGTINPMRINSDTYVTLQELAGKSRNDITDPAVQKMALLLQSLDNDDNATNGIKITDTAKKAISHTGNLKDKTENELFGDTVPERVRFLALNHVLTFTKSIDSTVTADFTPDIFSFTDMTYQSLDTAVLSNFITISNITIPTIISITGGEYSINGGSWTNTTGTITNGQRVQVKIITPSRYNSIATAMLSIGGISAAFNVSTIISALSPQTVPLGYELVWSDEFNGDSLDESKWSHRYLGKRKLGYTTADSIVISNGTLKNTIHKQDGKICSGMIGTMDKFEPKYGYFETKVKLPKIKGPQSAFWLMSKDYGKVIGNPQDFGVEVDIFEYVKTMPSKVHFTTHWDGYGANHKKDGFSLSYPAIEDGGWHTFGLLWTPDSYEFYVDGVLSHTKKSAVSHTNQYIILSAEIGEWGGGVAGENLPDQLEVDYVRVYQKP
jgi:hypothetical protein